MENKKHGQRKPVQKKVIKFKKKTIALMLVGGLGFGMFLGSLDKEEATQQATTTTEQGVKEEVVDLGNGLEGKIIQTTNGLGEPLEGRYHMIVFGGSMENYIDVYNKISTLNIDYCIVDNGVQGARLNPNIPFITVSNEGAVFNGGWELKGDHTSFVTYEVKDNQLVETK